MKIVKENYGIIHHIAYCNDCSWSDAIKTNENNRSAKLLHRVKEHIKKTTHSVSVESGSASKYYPLEV